MNRTAQYVITLCCVALASTVNAVEPPVTSSDAAIVRPFVDNSIYFILKVDPTRIGLPDLASIYESMSPEAQTAYRTVSQHATAGIKQACELVNNQPVYATFGIAVAGTRPRAFVFVKKGPEKDGEPLLGFLKIRFNTEARIFGDYVVATPLPGTEMAEIPVVSGAASQDIIADAFQSVASFPAQLLFVPPPHVWRTIKELSPELPRQLGGGPSRVLTEGLQWAALGVDPEQFRAELVIQSSSDTAARDLAAHLPKMLRAAYDAAPQFHHQIPVELLQATANKLKPQVKGNRILIRIDGLEEMSASLKLLAAGAPAVEDRMRRRKNSNRFKQMLIAMHNYHDTFKSFPPTNKCRGKDGKHHLSWRVHILPFVGQIQLYNKFHLDEPWDSPHNKALIGEMPDVYMSNSFDVPPKIAIKPGHTMFLAPVGDDTVFGGAEAASFRNIEDGTSNTIVLVEVKPENAVPWTAPDDYQFDLKDPAAGLAIGADGRWLCGFADGSVRQPRGDIPIETFLHLFQMGDGHPIDYNAIR